MFKLSSFSSSTRSQSFTPLLHCAVDNALIKTFPLVHDSLAKFFNICNLSLVVDPLPMSVNKKQLLTVENCCFNS